MLNEETGRAGGGMTASDYDRVKNLTPLDHECPPCPDQVFLDEGDNETKRLSGAESNSIVCKATPPCDRRLPLARAATLLDRVPCRQARR
jgi:hypothetical protein